MAENDIRIITVGAAVRDVFLGGTVLTPQYENDKWIQKFVMGEKYELDDVIFSTGGGATNAAVTFVRQGLRAMYMGKIGKDPSGKAMLEELHKENVDTSLTVVSDDRTGYSILLLAPEGGRSVLTYRGASSIFKMEDFELESMDGDWLYITSLAGNLEVLRAIVGSAKEKGMKVAINPGKDELMRADELKEILKQVDVLTLNKEEIQKLVEGADDEQLVRHCSDMVPTTVMTDGPNGVLATDRRQIVKAGMYEDVPVIDRTGAGDAFGSGLVAVLAKGRPLAEAIKFASANSTSVVNQIGAKTGILRGDVELHDMPMEVKDF